MKTIFKNCIYALRHFKVASVLNILGLSIAFTVFTMIFSLLYWEWGYNSSYNEGDRIHQAYITQEGSPSPMLSRPMAEMLSQSSASIESYSLISYADQLTGLIWKTVSSDLQIDTKVYGVNPAFVEMFEMEVVAGDLSKISAPGSAIVSESVARKYWNSTSSSDDGNSEKIIGEDWDYQSVLGEMIKCEKYEYTIVGVYRDFPSNAMTSNSIYTYLGELGIEDEAMVGFMAFYKLLPKVKMEDVVENMQNSWSEYEGKKNVLLEGREIKLCPIRDLYFSGVGSTEQGNVLVSMILLSVAMLIIFIGVVNYINFFISLIPIRIKNINISKIYGASSKALKSNIIIESIIILIISFALSLLFSQYISETIVNFSPTSLKVKDNLDVVTVVGVLALTVGALIGVFSSSYITKQNPAFVLRGSFGRSKAGRALRSILIGIQFTVAIFMIIGTGFVVLQNRYMKEFDYGFNKERLYTSEISLAAYSNRSLLEAELSKVPFIEEVAFSSPYLGPSSMVMSTRSENETITMNLLLCSYNFPEMAGIELAEGRYFREEDMTKAQTPSILINKTASTLLNFKVGDVMPGLEATIVGILDDFKFNSLHTGMSPQVIMGVSPLVPYPMNTLSIRVASGAKYSEVLTTLEEAILKVDPNASVESIKLKTIDESIYGLYNNEDTLVLMISIFALSCIIISLLGVISMIMFEAQHSRREVAVRKIYGSSILGILLKFNFQIIKVLIFSAVLALPLSWFAVDRWLSAYPFRVNMSWWVFALGVLVVFLIVSLTVTLQIYKSASENPTENLK